MKVEIWSDVSCPFCYIGKRTLENAVSKLGLEVDMEFKSFELDPFVPKNFEGNVYKYLAKKYGRSHDEVMQMTTPVLQRGKELGLVFNFDIAKHTNTFDAHRLIHLAKQEGLQLQAKDALLSAYFEKGIKELHTLNSPSFLRRRSRGGCSTSMCNSFYFKQSLLRNNVFNNFSSLRTGFL